MIESPVHMYIVPTPFDAVGVTSTPLSPSARSFALFASLFLLPRFFSTTQPSISIVLFSTFFFTVISRKLTQLPIASSFLGWRRSSSSGSLGTPVAGFRRCPSSLILDLYPEAPHIDSIFITFRFLLTAFYFSSPFFYFSLPA